MESYAVTLNMDNESKQYFAGHSYTLYIFKGMNAGAGAMSIIWKAISGEELLNTTTIRIEWNNRYYLGKTASKPLHLSAISDIEPYGRAGESELQLGNCYRRDATHWSPKTDRAPQREFRVINAPSKASVFYASQNNEHDFVVAQEARANGGIVTFEPLPTISMLVATDKYEVGTFVNEAFTSGAIVTLAPGSKSSRVDYDIFRGWRGPDVSMLYHGQPVHDQMIQSVRVSPDCATP